MNELMRLRDEATRLLTVYMEYRDSPDEHCRRKAHLDLDRFLMSHRGDVTMLLIIGADAQLDLDKGKSILLKESTNTPDMQAPPRRWYKKLFRKENYNDNNNQGHKVPGHS